MSAQTITDPQLRTTLGLPPLTVNMPYIPPVPSGGINPAVFGYGAGSPPTWPLYALGAGVAVFVLWLIWDSKK